METTIEIGNKTLKVYGADPDMVLPEIEDDMILENANETASNGADDFAIYYLADDAHQLEIYLEQGYPSYAEINTRRPMRDVVLDCEYDIDRPEWLSAWGLDPELTEADENSTASTFRIWDTPNYYEGTNNAPQAGWWKNEETNEAMEFNSYAEAEEVVDEYYDEPSAYDGIPQCNVLSHGQAGSDDLIIVEW